MRNRRAARTRRPGSWTGIAVWSVAGLMLIAGALLYATFAKCRTSGNADGSRIVISNGWGTPMSAIVTTADGSVFAGPLTPSGLAHGEWVAGAPDGSARSMWYWYGEQKTEGEWATIAR